MIIEERESQLKKPKKRTMEVPVREREREIGRKQHAQEGPINKCR
jgi:hypothetical protein